MVLDSRERGALADLALHFQLATKKLDNLERERQS